MQSRHCGTDVGNSKIKRIPQNKCLLKWQAVMLSWAALPILWQPELLDLSTPRSSPASSPVSDTQRLSQAELSFAELKKPSERD